MEEVTITQDLTDIIQTIPAGTNLQITIIQNGNAPTKKKCYVWKDGMMIRVPCSGEHDGEIEYD